MNARLTAAAAVAVILASLAEFSIISGVAWLVAASGAVLVVALAGTLTRLAPVHAAVGATLIAIVVTMPLLAAHSPWLKVLGALIIACCAASAWRLNVLRVVAGLVSYLGALLLYLNVLMARSQSVIAIIPTATSLHHLTKLASAGSGMTASVPPVSDTPGVLLLAAGSIGLVAVIVDMVAVRLHRPAIAGLPLLVVYLAPIATTAKVSGLGELIAFLLAAAGYLTLLSSDGKNRLRGWGRVITVWHTTGEDERLGGADVATLAATGRRIGLAAVCAALIAPLLLPSLNLHHLFGGGGRTGPGGSNAVQLPNPVDELHGLLHRSKPLPVLTYRSRGRNPGTYLGVYVLNYDPSQRLWNLVPPSGTVPVSSGGLLQPTGPAIGTTERFTTTNIALGQVTRGYTAPVFFLPVPYWPTHLTVNGTWRESAETLQIYSSEVNTSGLTYQVISGQVVPSQASISAVPAYPAAISRAYLGFRSSVTPQLRAIARQIAGNQPNPFLKAVALQRWFQSGEFTYSLNSNIPNSARGLLTFLTKHRSGYCQQFAFAMAVLARLLGIPSRIAIGYTSGTQLADGRWQVTTADAHAWPELYFTDLGWLRFEPTPGGNVGQQTAVVPSYVAALGGPNPRASISTNPLTGATTGGALPTASTGRLNNRLRPAPGNGLNGTTGTQRGGSVAGILGLAVLAVLVLAVATPATARVVTRRRRWSAATHDDAALAEAAWLEICADLDDFGLPCRASDSPRAVARRVCSETEGDEVAERAIGRVTTVVERARYAPGPAPADSIQADVRLVRRSLARSVGLIARIRARLLPASTLGPLRVQVGHLLGLLTGWMPSTSEEAGG